MGGSRFSVAGAMFLLPLVACAVARAELPGRIVSAYQSASNSDTPIGVTDGNPLAATAVFSNSMYRQLGFELAQPAHFDISMSGSYGSFNSGGVHDGDFGTVDLSFSAALGKRVGLLVTVPFGYRDTYGAKVYSVGLGVALPITVIEGDCNWTVSPWGLFGGVDGTDLAQGGVQGGGGVTSLVRFELAENRLHLAMTNQAGYIAGQPYGYGSSFNFEQNISQVILKNGFELSGTLSKSWEAYGSITYTNLTDDAYVDSYWTPEAGLRWGLTHFHATLAAFGDFGDRYSGYGARAAIGFEW